MESFDSVPVKSAERGGFELCITCERRAPGTKDKPASLKYNVYRGDRAPTPPFGRLGDVCLVSDARIYVRVPHRWVEWGEDHFLRNADLEHPVHHGLYFWVSMRYLGTWVTRQHMHWDTARWGLNPRTRRRVIERVLSWSEARCLRFAGERAPTPGKGKTKEVDLSESGSENEVTFLSPPPSPRPAPSTPRARHKSTITSDNIASDGSSDGRQSSAASKRLDATATTPSTSSVGNVGAKRPTPRKAAASHAPATPARTVTVTAQPAHTPVVARPAPTGPSVSQSASRPTSAKSARNATATVSAPSAPTLGQTAGGPNFAPTEDQLHHMRAAVQNAFAGALDAAPDRLVALWVGLSLAQAQMGASDTVGLDRFLDLARPVGAQQTNGPSGSSLAATHKNAQTPAGVKDTALLRHGEGSSAAAVGHAFDAGTSGASRVDGGDPRKRGSSADRFDLCHDAQAPVLSKKRQRTEESSPLQYLDNKSLTQGENAKAASSNDHGQQRRKGKRRGKGKGKG